MSPTEAIAVADWHYEGPWRVYDLNGHIPDAIDDYYSVCDPSPGGGLIGFFCVGYEARVPGLEAVDGTLDLGWGMNPEWVGQRYGNAFGAAVLTEAQLLHQNLRQIRAVVQTWNLRSIGVLRKLGFASRGTHTCVQQGQPVQYDILIRTLP